VRSKRAKSYWQIRNSAKPTWAKPNFKKRQVPSLTFLGKFRGKSKTSKQNGNGQSHTAKPKSPSTEKRKLPFKASESSSSKLQIFLQPTFEKRQVCFF
jgi:hypothetical protein